MVKADQHSESIHVLLVGGMFIAHEELAAIPGVRTTYLIRAHKLKQRDLPLHQRILAVPDGDFLPEAMAVAEAVHTRDRFDRIACFHEPLMPEAAAIAQRLRLGFLTPGAVARVTDKLLMREVLRSHGVDSTFSAGFDSRQEAEKIAADLETPIVVKPRDGMGSTGVSIVRSREELGDAVLRLEAEAGTTAGVIEEYLTGRELSVEGFAVDGRHYCLGITEKFKDPQTCVEIGHLMPARGLSDGQVAAVAGYVAKVMAALGVTQGPTHTEVMIDGADATIIETHVRPGGDYLPECLALLSGEGANLIKLSAQLYAGTLEKISVPRPARGDDQPHVAVWFARAEHEGVVTAVRGAEEALTMAGVDRAEALVSVGDKVRPAQNSFERTGFAIAAGETAESALARARRAAESITVDVEAS